MDNLLERLIAAAAAAEKTAAAEAAGSEANLKSPLTQQNQLHPLHAVRLGHPARQSPAVLAHSLDALLAGGRGGGGGGGGNDWEVLQGLREDLEDVNRKLTKSREMWESNTGGGSSTSGGDKKPKKIKPKKKKTLGALSFSERKSLHRQARCVVAVGAKAEKQ